MKLFCSISMVLVMALSNAAMAEVPNRLIYSGNLSQDGKPFEGSVDILFSIYDSAAGGSILWSESHQSVEVKAGKFSVELGLSDKLKDVFDGGKYYLEVSVDDQVMLPRVPVASVPYAFSASKADDCDKVGGKTPDELLAGEVTASGVSYDNANSGLAASDVQAALDEVMNRLKALESNYETLQDDYETLQQQYESLQESVANISWNDLKDIPAGFADGVDDEGSATVSWSDIIDMPAGFADGTDDGLTSVAWNDIQNRPQGLDDGDDVGMTSVSWSDIKNIPAGFADGTDDGLTSVSWNDIQNTSNIIHSGTDFIFRGLNVRVQSGTGYTNGTVNGLGNLIIGYDEARSSGSDKSGSHNLVVGAKHNYPSYAGIVAGYVNTISGAYSSVIGGTTNTASGPGASVIGGYGNTADGSRSTVTGGGTNTASGSLSSVTGGYHNTASATYSSISGGSQNNASGDVSSVSGGNSNTASGGLSSVTGGFSNTALGDYSSVSGGRNRSVSGPYDWRAGAYFQDD